MVNAIVILAQNKKKKKKKDEHGEEMFAINASQNINVKRLLG